MTVSKWEIYLLLAVTSIAVGVWSMLIWEVTH